MKILQINASNSNGSTGMITNRIHEEIISSGNEGFVIVTQKSNIKENIYDVSNRMEYYVHALLSRITGKQGFYSSFSTRKMIKIIKKIKPDIVHLHILHANNVNLNLLLPALKDIPVVITLHDCWWWTGKCFFYIEKGCEKWKTQCDHCPQKKEYIRNYFFDTSSYVFKRKKKLLLDIQNLTLVGVSNWINEQCQQSFLSNKHHTVIYNGIDLSIFSPHAEKIDFKGKKVILGMMTKWAQPFNREIVLEIIKKFSNCLIVLLGKEEKEFVNDNVLFIPSYLSHKELARYYSSANVFVNLSMEDTMSLVTVEAMACGTPVVVYNSTALPELVEQDKTGYVVDYGNNETMLDAIEKCLSGRIKSEDCRKRALSFDGNLQYKKYIKLYERIIKRKND